MTTLITAYGYDNKIIGRCDSNCYDAKTPDCACICGGRNHGRGLGPAAARTNQTTDEKILAYLNPDHLFVCKLIRRNLMD